MARRDARAARPNVKGINPSGRKCAVCSHEKRNAINRDLSRGVHHVEIGRRYPGLTIHMIRNHLGRDHISQQMLRGGRVHEANQADRLLDDINELRDRAMSILAKAEAASNWQACALLLREARGCLELLAELEKRIDRKPIVNVLISNEWLTIRAAMFDELNQHPEIRDRILRRLRSLGSATAIAGPQVIDAEAEEVEVVLDLESGVD